MKVRIGYVSQNLSQNITPSHTITVSNFNKIQDKQDKINKLVEIGKINLQNTLEILKWNVEHDIYVYRFSSKLVPLATWNGFSWDYKEHLKREFEEVGEYVKQNNIRVSAHPDHFSVMNTPKEEIFQATIKDLMYHHEFLQAMGLDEAYKLVVHVGGAYGDKTFGKEQFIRNFTKLPIEIKQRITVENDDKSYDIQDVLEICKTLHIPMILDVHHFKINNRKDRLTVRKLKEIFATWDQEYFPPKVHFSSPRSKEQKRAHADYILPKDWEKFIKLSKQVGEDFDIMIEAKAKDLAVLEIRTKEIP